MKSIYKLIICGTIACTGLSACTDDLDVTPIDPSTITYDGSEDMRLGMFNKLYATFALTGQNGPDGNGDVDGIDEGTSALYRMMWELNEFSSDGGFWNWHADAGVSQIYNLTWNSSNSLVQGLYCRLYFDITLCNNFIDLFNGSSDNEVAAEVAEARWIRAYNYYLLLDMFQDVPFADKITTESPKQITRAELFSWLETELKELETELPESKINSYRVDRIAAKFLLMRMYLNAEVYCGTDRYTDAANYAAQIMNSKYTLAPKYAEMFMGDNNSNQNPQAASEFVFSIYQNGQYTRMWGGNKLTICGMRDAFNLPYGSSDSWSCFRSSPSLFIGTWFTEEEALAIKNTAVAHGYEYANEKVMPTLAGDDRCILCQSCNNGTEFDCDLSSVLSYISKKTVGDNGSTFSECWTICKWTGTYSDGTEVGTDVEFPDTDLPLLRASEAYLTYAEAVLRGGTAVNGTAQEAIDALRKRANCTHSFNVSLDNILDEWQREFYSEGRRRTDLIRFRHFTGDYSWEGKYGSRDERFNVFPIPESDIVANSNLKQYLGY